MPTYTYECQECKLIFEEFHAMAETIEECKKCNSPVKRLLSSALNIKKNRNFGRKKPGSIVKQYIKGVKEELKQEKKRVTAQEYEVK